MEHKAPKAEDITYTYNNRGYMMYYKGQPIGGAGIDKRAARSCRRNIPLFQKSAEATKRQLVAGCGDSYMMNLIRAIDKASKEE